MHTKSYGPDKKIWTERHRTAIVATMSNSPQAGSTIINEAVWIWLFFKD